MRCTFRASDDLILVKYLDKYPGLQKLFSFNMFNAEKQGEARRSKLEIKQAVFSTLDAHFVG